MSRTAVIGSGTWGSALAILLSHNGHEVTVWSAFQEEIDSFIWVDLQQARKLCSYDNDLRIIDKAETTIHLMRN